MKISLKVCLTASRLYTSFSFSFPIPVFPLRLTRDIQKVYHKNMEKTNKKVRLVHIRLSEEEYQTIKKKAEMVGLPISSLLRFRALTYGLKEDKKREHYR